MPNPLDISDEEYRSLAQHIESEQSVVGIDAKKTHILILHLLTKMQEKIDHLEQKMDALNKGH